MTLDELKRLAEIVYPDKEFRHERGGLVVHVVNLGRDIQEEFSPSLTGYEWQKAQALDCIVAAMGLHEVMHLSKDCDGVYIDYQDKDDYLNAIGEGPDILSAAAQALVAKGES